MKKKSNITRNKVQEQMLKIIDLLDQRMDLEDDVRDIDIKDITLLAKILSDMGAYDDIIAKEHEELTEVRDKNFKVVFSKDIKKQKQELGLG